MLYYVKKNNNFNYFLFDYFINESTFISYKPIK